jgi:hypothetical protein
VSSDDGIGLLQRLLDDPGFRARFRHDPAAAAREAGFEDFAQALDSDPHRTLETLEIRESRSSMAGAMLGAVVEGLGLFEFSGDVAHPPERALADNPSQSAGVQGESGATRPVASKEVISVEAQAPSGDSLETDEPLSGDHETDNQHVDDDLEAADDMDDKEADEDEPDEDEPDEDEPAEEETGADEPEGDYNVEDNSDGNDDGGKAADSSDDGQDSDRKGGGSVEPTPAPSGTWKPEPAQYGMAGGGGPRSPYDAAVLKDSSITLDANGREDFTTGRMDPRVGALLLRLAEKHKLTLSTTTSDHAQFTAGGSTSNHWYGRAFDIATVDGEIVRPGSGAARQLAAELARLDASIRPSEIGSPWSIPGPGYFTDAAHQNHIHIGFDEVIDREWRPANETRMMPAVRIGR